MGGAASVTTSSSREGKQGPSSSYHALSTPDIARLRLVRGPRSLRNMARSNRLKTLVLPPFPADKSIRTPDSATAKNSVVIRKYGESPTSYSAYVTPRVDGNVPRQSFWHDDTAASPLVGGIAVEASATASAVTVETVLAELETAVNAVEARNEREGREERTEEESKLEAGDAPVTSEEIVEQHKRRTIQEAKDKFAKTLNSLKSNGFRFRPY